MLIKKIEVFNVIHLISLPPVYFAFNHSNLEGFPQCRLNIGNRRIFFLKKKNMNVHCMWHKKKGDCGHIYKAEKK